MSNEVPIKDQVSVDTESNIEIEIKEKIFARMCQIIDEKGIITSQLNIGIASKEVKAITVPAEKYDELEKYILNGDFFNKTDKEINFFSEDLKQRLVVLMILEHHTKVELDSLDDIIDAVINPARLKGKVISAKEDDSGKFVIFELNK